MGIWGVAKEEDVSVGAETTQDGGSRGRVNGESLGTNWDLAIITDPNLGLEAPDIRPPWAGRCGAQDGAFFGQSQRFGRLRSGAQFAVNLVEIYVGQDLVQQCIGRFEIAKVLSGEQSWKALLPEVMASLNLALGLRGGSIKQRHPVEVQSGAQLSKSFRGVGEEKGMVIDVECQGQAVRAEGPREEIEVSQERFGRIEAGTNVIAGCVIQDIEQHLFIQLAGQPAMMAGIVLPERAQVASLPALERSGPGFEASVGGQLVVDRPAADAGPVGFEVEAAKQFAGRGAVGGGRFGRKELLEQGDDLRRPIWVVIPAGGAGRPIMATAASTGAQVLAE